MRGDGMVTCVGRGVARDEPKGSLSTRECVAHEGGDGLFADALVAEPWWRFPNEDRHLSR